MQLLDNEFIIKNYYSTKFLKVSPTSLWSLSSVGSETS